MSHFKAESSLPVESRQLTRSTTHRLRIELDKVFITSPELRPYFHSGYDIDTKNKNYLKAVAISDFMIDLFDLFWSQADKIPHIEKGGSAWQAWRQYIGDCFKNSPVLTRRFEEVKSWYSKDFVRFIEDLTQEN